MDKSARNIRNAVQLGERLLCDLREFETSGRSPLDEDIMTIICRDGKEEFIHRFISRSASPVFADVSCESQMSGPIHLDVSSDILRIIVDFIYSTQNLRFSSGQALALFAAARRFGIVGLTTSICEAVDVEFFNSFVDDEDSMTRVSESDVEGVIELFAPIKMDSERVYRLSKKIRVWAGMNEDRLPMFQKLFDALIRLDGGGGHIAEPPRLEDETVALLWRGDVNGTLRLCRLRILEDGEPSLDKTDNTIESSLAAGGHFAMSGELLFKLGENALEAFKLHPNDPKYEKLHRLNERFNGLGCTTDGEIFVWSQRTIHFVTIVDGLLTKTRVGDASSDISEVHFIEGSSDRSPCFAIVEIDPSFCIEFMECQTGHKRTPPLTVPGFPYAVSSNSVVVRDRDELILLKHDFEDCLDSRSFGGSGMTYDARIIGSSRVLLLQHYPSLKTPFSFTIFEDSDEMEKYSEVRLDCVTLCFAHGSGTPDREE